MVETERSARGHRLDDSVSSVVRSTEPRSELRSGRRLRCRAIATQERGAKIRRALRDCLSAGLVIEIGVQTHGIRPRIALSQVCDLLLLVRCIRRK